MKISLRERASKKTGKTTLYIEYYKGYSKSPEGKIKHKREYEYLDLYLITKPKSKVERQNNKETKAKAEQILAKRKLEAANGKHNFKDTFKQKASFVDYFQKLTDNRKESKANYENWYSCLLHLRKYTKDNPHVTFQDVNKTFIEGFKTYLLQTTSRNGTKKLSQNTAHTYFNKFKATIKQATDEGIFTVSPLKGIKGIKAGDPKREYLTLEEIKILAKAECDNEVLKRAFIFSCLTGLRWSDINKLLWEDVKEDQGEYRIIYKQKKTKQQEYLDIPKQAVKLMGEKQKGKERVFKGLKYSAWNNLLLQKWVLKAGIKKDITFHCARHTYATLQLTLGTDIYTVSKLLGHKHIKTTEIYTKVIDEKKKEAANKIPDIDL